MPDLFINPTGASASAEAALAYLRQGDGLECSWASGGDYHEYEARPKVDRWHNCREQGYVVWMKSKDYKKQINIAFFEHRNSDQIHAVVWEQVTINPPTVDTMHDTTFYVNYDGASAMADFVIKKLEEFWEQGQ